MAKTLLKTIIIILCLLIANPSSVFACLTEDFSEINKEIEQLNDKKTEIEEKINRIKEELKKYKSDIYYRKEIVRVTAQIILQEKVVDYWNLQRQVVKAQLERAKLLGEPTEALEKKLKEIGRELKIQEDALRILEDRRAKLYAALSIVSELQNELNFILKIQLSRIKRRIKKLEKEKKELKEQLKKLEQQIEDKKDEIKDLKGKLESLESELAGETDCGEIEKLKSEISAMKTKITKAKAELKQLHKDHGC